MIGNRYTQLREIGRGGMGVVWLAQDEVLGRSVALKVVGHSPAGDDTSEAVGLLRAQREAELAASLNHPHVVGVYDLVSDGARRWLVMEYVEGADLGTLLKQQGPLTPHRAAAVLAQVADALAAAHRTGMIHRDVKPSNILLDAEDHARLTDFGIARARGDVTLTSTGLVTGSPAYLAPEVASGRQATPASDVWSLGATLFHALSGAPPYDTGGNAMATMYRIVHEDPPRLPHAGRLTEVLAATMAVDPAKRWSMARVHKVLAEIARGDVEDAAPADVSGRTVALPAQRARSTQRTRSARSTRVAPAPARPEGTAHRRRTRLVAAALAGVLLLGGGGVVLATALDGSEPASAADGPAPSASTEPVPTVMTAADMSAFVEDYLAQVTENPAATWRQLTPTFQDQSGGFGRYRAFWSRIAEAEVLATDPDPSTGTIGYTVRYTRPNGTRFTDDPRLQLVFVDGRYLIAGEA